MNVVAEQLVDHTVELAIADGCPEGVFGPGVKMPVEEIEVGAEMVGQREEPKLVGGPDVEDTLETERAGCMMDLRGWVETDLSIAGVTIDIEVQHEARVGQWVVVKGEL